MSEQIPLGKLIEGESHRDAVHVAIVPLIAGEWLMVGDNIKLAYGTVDTALRAYREDEEIIGIVDPFLETGVEKGERFYGVLKPGTITGLRHHWSHPKFDGPVANNVNEHEVWLRKFAEKWGFDYDDLIYQCELGNENSYVCAHGKDLHYAGELGDDYVLMWHHLEKLIGKKFPDEHREKIGWTCSC